MGYDQDRRFTSDMQEGNMAGSLSDGYDGYRGYPDDNRNQRYNPMSGETRRRDPRDQNDNRRQDRSRTWGGYDANNMSPDERHRNR